MHIVSHFHFPVHNTRKFNECDKENECTYSQKVVGVIQFEGSSMASNYVSFLAIVDITQ